MKIRAYKSGDIDAILSVWNCAMPYTPLNRRAFIKNILLDHNFDEKGFLIAEEKGEILGFIYGIVRRFPVDVGAPADEKDGYINAIGMKNREDVLGGLGLELIRAVEDYIGRAGKERIFVSNYTPNYIYQGIHTSCADYLELFRKAGYEEHERSASIAIDLLTYKASEEICELKKQREKEGFVFAHAKAENIPSLMKFERASWIHRYRRLLQETLDFERINLIVYEDEVVGCCVFGDPYSSEERFGPFGVSEKFRGMGLGKILLQECLCTMKERGLQKAWAQNTPLNAPASFLYRKTGFERTGEYVVFVKQEI